MFHLLAATGNAHKIQEFRSLLTGLEDKITIHSLKEFPGYQPAEENGTTFEENSAIKSISASAFARMMTFADDSGLAVDALNGAPGIFSARYAGENATDADRIAKLLGELKEVTCRTAKFVCVVTLAENGKLIASFRGEIKGTITEAPRGVCGFGYDPIFLPDGYTRTFAELTMEEKDRISHRAIAMGKAVDYIRRELVR